MSISGPIRTFRTTRTNQNVVLCWARPIRIKTEITQRVRWCDSVFGSTRVAWLVIVTNKRRWWAVYRYPSLSFIVLLHCWGWRSRSLLFSRSLVFSLSCSLFLASRSHSFPRPHSLFLSRSFIVVRSRPLFGMAFLISHSRSLALVHSLCFSLSHSLAHSLCFSPSHNSLALSRFSLFPSL